jgi:DNA gyrase subunit B
MLSAASGLVAARDSEYQAVYGVRGKMLSILKTTPDKVMKNQEINNIVVALGLDYNPATGKMKYDKKKLRYDKIIACADAK